MPVALACIRSFISFGHNFLNKEFIGLGKAPSELDMLDKVFIFLRTAHESLAS